jgi:putative transposase
MPRQPRLDAPDTLHHVMVRGIERTQVFRDDTDRADFVARVAHLAEQGAWIVYAWALLPTHAHSSPGTPGLLTGGTSGSGTCSRTGTNPSWWRRSRTSWSWFGTFT